MTNSHSPSSAESTSERELFADVTKHDLVGAVGHLRDFLSVPQREHREQYADLIEAQAKLIAHFVAARDQSEPVAWRVKNEFGHWYITIDRPLAVEKKDVQPLYVTPAAAKDPGALIEACAKIAEPWAGFWLDNSSTDADRAVVAVRTEIAAKIRALIPNVAQREQELSLEIESLKGAMQVLSEGYDRITAERDAALATHTPAALVETDDITEIVRCNARTTLIGFRDELSDDNIDFICDQVARKSQLDYVELAPVSRSSAGIEVELDFSDPLTSSIMGAARLHTHDHTMAYSITREVLAVVRAQPQPPLIQNIEAEARRYAEMYPQSSDGRNTFIIFADWVASLALSRPHRGSAE